ncbi:Nucleolar protein 13 [Dipsacomyces acuminosporus]|nr:Nucleolar protein 13 [Dipsacomyces acuminosporus]
MSPKEEKPEAAAVDEREVKRAAKKAEKEAKRAEKLAKKDARHKARQAKALAGLPNNEPAKEGSNEESASAEKAEAGAAKKEKKEKKRSEWAVWIGNLPYSVSRDDLAEFFKPCGGTITRINLPKKSGKICGFAYIDFDTERAMNNALIYSEQELGGRAVLIKNANDFKKTGKPSRVATKSKDADENSKQSSGSKDKKDSSKDKDSDKDSKKSGNSAKKQKSDPSPCLFVGNLSFDTKKSDLKAIFRPFGDIAGVRVATFEDNPEKCKGFAYVDFVYTDDATRAMASPDTKTIGGRRVRIEYAGDYATRKGRPWEFDTHSSAAKPNKRTHKPEDESNEPSADVQTNKSRKLNTDNMAETKLQGLAVEFEGKKITFGE